jgi:hypothetical protein
LAITKIPAWTGTWNWKNYCIIDVRKLKDSCNGRFLFFLFFLQSQEENGVNYFVSHFSIINLNPIWNSIQPALSSHYPIYTNFLYCCACTTSSTQKGCVYPNKLDCTSSCISDSASESIRLHCHLYTNLYNQVCLGKHILFLLSIWSSFSDEEYSSFEFFLCWGLASILWKYSHIPVKARGI